MAEGVQAVAAQHTYALMLVGAWTSLQASMVRRVWNNGSLCVLRVPLS